MQPVKRDGKVELICRMCGKKEKMTEQSFKISEKIEHDVTTDEIPVVDETTKVQALPVTKIECPKCGHDTAEWWTMQTRSSDEPETRFYRCLKCKHTWREYS